MKCCHCSRPMDEERIAKKRKTCRTCSFNNGERVKTKRRERLTAGICVICGVEKIDPSGRAKTMCSQCTRYQGAKRRACTTDDGKCFRCRLTIPEDRRGKSRCQPCSKAESEAHRARVRRKEQAA